MPQIEENIYRQVSNIRRTESQHLKDSITVENEAVVGAALTGDAPTTSERSTILFPS